MPAPASLHLAATDTGTPLLESLFQIKRFVVRTSAALGPQSHVSRLEHRIAVAGTAKVTAESEARLMTENQSIHMPSGAKHRMENSSGVTTELVEVRTASYLGDDDIILYEVVHARDQGAVG